MPHGGSSAGAALALFTAALSDAAHKLLYSAQRMHLRTLCCARYSPEQLFSVVADVDHYHEFVPWCQRSEVLVRRDMEYVEAELEVGFKLFVERCARAHVCRPQLSPVLPGLDISRLWDFHERAGVLPCVSMQEEMQVAYFSACITSRPAHVHSSYIYA